MAMMSSFPVSSFKIANLILCLWALKELIVGVIHGFKQDGGVETIAGYPLSTSGCKDEMLFAISILSEKNVLVFMLVYLIAFKASDLVPYTIATLTLNYIHLRVMQAYRPGLLDRLIPNAPGRHNVWVIPLLLVLSSLAYFCELRPKAKSIEVADTHHVSSGFSARAFSSFKIANLILCLWALKELIVGVIHGFKADGGVESIAGYPLSTSGCQDEMIFAFCFLSEKNVLVFMLVFLIAFKAADLVPYTIATLTLNYIHFRIMQACRPGLLDRLFPNAPGRHNVWVIPLLLLLSSLAYFYERKPKSQVHRSS